MDVHGLLVEGRENFWTCVWSGVQWVSGRKWVVKGDSSTHNKSS